VPRQLARGVERVPAVVLGHVWIETVDEPADVPSR
jgi:hypothetical protein